MTNTKPDDSMEYNIWETEFSEMFSSLETTDYQQMILITDKFLELEDVFPEATALEAFDAQVQSVENISAPHIATLSSEDAWRRITLAVDLLKRVTPNHEWLLFAMAYTYVFANMIGDW
jgi:hypothetical protein